MNFKDLGALIGKAAPLLGGLIAGGPVGAGAAALGMVADALGIASTEPDTIAEAFRADPQAAVKIAEIESSERVALSRLTLENETARLTEVNKTMRAEVASGDKFTQRARPSFLYIIALSVLAEVLLTFFVIAIMAYMGEDSPLTIFDLALVFEALAVPQGIGLTACGVYIKQRTNEKGMGVGIAPTGLLGMFSKK